MLLFEFILVFWALLNSCTSLETRMRKHFEWAPSMNLATRINWIDERVPCEDDDVRLDVGNSDDDGVSISLLNASMKMSTLTLSQNGVFFFSTTGGQKAISIGEMEDKNDAGTWQCEKREDSQEAVFQPTESKPNFFDPKNWQIFIGSQRKNEPMLDIEKVPSDMDAVYVPLISASKMFLNQQARVREFFIGNQSLTTQRFYRLLLTLEGQFQFRLGYGSALVTQLSIDGIVYRWPQEKAIVVDGAVVNLEKTKQFGRMHSNLQEPQFTELCQLVQCIPVEAYCSEPIKPRGSCCPICGGYLTFRQSTLNFSLAQEIVAQLEMSLSIAMGISLIRLDDHIDGLLPFYQLSILPEHPSFYDEDLTYTILWKAFYRLQQRGTNSQNAGIEYHSFSSVYYDLQYFYSSQSSKIHLTKVIKNCAIIFALLAVAGLAFRSQYQRDVRFRLFVQDHFGNSRLLAEQLRVGFNRAIDRVDLQFRQNEQNATLNLLTKNDAFDDEYAIGHCSEYHSKEAVDRVFQFQNPAFDATSTA